MCPRKKKELTNSFRPGFNPEFDNVDSKPAQFRKIPETARAVSGIFRNCAGLESTLSNSGLNPGRNEFVSSFFFRGHILSTTYLLSLSAVSHWGEVWQVEYSV